MSLINIVKEITLSHLDRKDRMQPLTCPRCEVLTLDGGFCGEHIKEVAKEILDEQQKVPDRLHADE
jgi:hypothetical protein